MAKVNKRHMIQALGLLAFNGSLKGFFTGAIYTGSSKKVCVPVLNCYACPGAVGSCPIGSIQATMNSTKFDLPSYALGLTVLFGILLGRFFCGYLCPFGFFQDLLHKIPVPKFKLPEKVSGVLKYLKYVILAVFVFTLPLLTQDKYGSSNPYFCKYICPSGTLLAAVPLLLTNPMLRTAIGGLFYWKMAILIAIIILSLILYRPFCHYLCPLGALFGLFHPISVYRFRIEDSCIKCGRCQKACGFDIKTYQTPNSPECIRCDECVKACPVNAIQKEFSVLDLTKKNKKDLSKKEGP